jgi:toxin-antitoxin system PIN domain toxin
MTNRIALLDINVLVSLFDPAHPHHEAAHSWFGHNRKRGWATCSITLAGCVRVLSNPAYPTVEATAAEVISRLRSLCSGRDHHFWSESPSLLDQDLFLPQFLSGYKQITDMCLLATAIRNKGKLATFDRSIPLKTVAGATDAHLEVL